MQAGGTVTRCRKMETDVMAGDWQATTGCDEGAGDDGGTWRSRWKGKDGGGGMRYRARQREGEAVVN